jgi:predicted nucleotidyltransferase
MGEEMEQLMSVENALATIKSLLAHNPYVKVAYLFGSCARGDVGPLSDVDIAVLLDGRVSPFEFRLRLSASLAQALGSEYFDLVTLNDAPLLLKYEVVRGGRVIKEDKKIRVTFETRVLSEYLDTAYLRRTQRAYLKEQLAQGGTFGQ